MPPKRKIVNGVCEKMEKMIAKDRHDAQKRAELESISVYF